MNPYILILAFLGALVLSFILNSAPRLDREIIASPTIDIPEAINKMSEQGGLFEDHWNKIALSGDYAEYSVNFALLCDRWVPDRSVDLLSLICNEFDSGPKRSTLLNELYLQWAKADREAALATIADLSDNRDLDVALKAIFRVSHNPLDRAQVSLLRSGLSIEESSNVMDGVQQLVDGTAAHSTQVSLRQKMHIIAPYIANTLIGQFGITGFNDWLKSIEDLEISEAIKSSGYTYALQTDFDQAISAFTRHPSWKSNESLVSAIVKTLSDGEDPLKAITFLDKNPDIRIVPHVDNLLAATLRSDPELALRIMKYSNETRGWMRGFSGIAGSIAKTNGEEVRRWLATTGLTSPFRSVGYHEASGDVSEAISAGRKLEGTQRDRYLQGVGQYMGRFSPQEAMRITSELPESEQKGYLRGVVEGWAKRDPSAAAEFVTGQHPGDEMAVQAIATIWADTEPANAAQWLSELETPPSNAVESLMAKWSQYDPTAASEWLSTFDDAHTEARDLAARQLIQHSALEDLETSIQWLVQINDLETQKRTFLAFFANLNVMREVPVSDEVVFDLLSEYSSPLDEPKIEAIYEMYERSISFRDDAWIDSELSR